MSDRLPRAGVQIRRGEEAEGLPKQKGEPGPKGDPGAKGSPAKLTAEQIKNVSDANTLKELRTAILDALA